MSTREPRRRDLLDHLIDGDTPDWSHPDTREEPLLEALHTLDQVRSAYQRIGATAAPGAKVLFQWGSLEVLEKIGSGMSAEVYRAWDPGLGTLVALKLLRPEAAAAGLRSEEFLREGRMLARVSQRNVLRVYGAAVHAGRPGIWTECIDGRTLDAIVEADGPLAEVEAVHVGAELCAALAAMHCADLVHGDVKASNVMRAHGGRIVLADFGAAGAPEALNASLRTQATPAYLSPQARDGAPRAAVDDLYALAVLLHFLLTGAYPQAGVSRLRELIPTVAPHIADAIERALSPDPLQRPATAPAFADALSPGSARTRFANVPRRRGGRLILPAVGFAAIALVAAWWSWPAPAWRQQVELTRMTDNGSEPLRDGATLHLGDRIQLAISANQPTWAYVLNEDQTGTLNVLFPLSGLEQRNPLPADREARLPGQKDGRSLTWEVSSSGGHEEFLVILADTPLRALESRLTKYASATIEPIQRGVGRVSAGPPVNVRVHGSHLNAVLSESAAEITDSPHVRVLSYAFESPAAK